MDKEIVLDHRCLECGYQGYVVAKNKKIVCPKCETQNDWWLEGDEPPENHK